MELIAPYYKAVTALLVPFLTAIGAALLPTSDGGSTVMANEWIGAVVIGLVAGAAVFAAPANRPRAGVDWSSQERLASADDYQPRHIRGENGAFDTGWLVAGAALVIIICGIVWLIQAT